VGTRGSKEGKVILDKRTSGEGFGDISRFEHREQRGPTMAEDTLRVIARIKACPNKVGELLFVLSSLVESTRKEPGCLNYILMQNNEDPTDFTFAEKWQSNAALEAHFKTKHFKDALITLPNLLAAEPEMKRYHVAR
jgi:quinol monooxygenase YgiN